MPAASPPATATTLSPSLSIWLDLCRVLAALAVYVGHSVVLGLAPEALSLSWHRSADDAVIAFFVISGFVIAYSTRSRHGSAGHYALARVSRIYSVAIPAVLLALLLDTIGLRIGPEAYAGYAWQYPHAALVPPYHWLFLGEGWFGSWQPFSMEPYWSLAYEVWYYALFGVFMYARAWWRWPLLLLVLGFMGPAVLMLLPVWCLGVFLCRHLGALRLGRWPARALMLVCALAYAAFFLSGARTATDEASRALYAAIAAWAPFPFQPGSTVHVLSDYVTALLFAGFVVGCAGADWGFSERMGRLIRWLADRTFSFYLIHFSLLVLARAAGVSASGWAGYAALLAGVLLATWALGQIGEQRREAYRAVFRWLAQLARRGVEAVVPRLRP
jgi:peptidoglycan/LPS O-acetylase OafA/YrhL